MSPIFTDLSDNRMIPETISLKVCCNPSPIPTSKAADPERLVVSFGKNSRYLIWEQPPEGEIKLLKNSKVLVQQKSAPLGEPVSFSKDFFQDGPYLFEAAVTLPNGQKIVEKEFYFHGQSPHQLSVYDPSGKPIISPWPEEVALLNSNFETVEQGIRQEKSGN